MRIKVSCEICGVVASVDKDSLRRVVLLDNPFDSRESLIKTLEGIGTDGIIEQCVVTTMRSPSGWLTGTGACDSVIDTCPHCSKHYKIIETSLDTDKFIDRLGQHFMLDLLLNWKGE